MAKLRAQQGIKCAQGIKIPKPWQQVLDDIVTFAKPHESQGNEVIIMMHGQQLRDEGSRYGILHGGPQLA
jgi:hypothetical protein